MQLHKLLKQVSCFCLIAIMVLLSFLSWILQMFDVDTRKREENFGQAGLRLYKQNCMSCHGPERKGSGNYPSIVDVGKKYDPRSFIEFINAGRRMMPSFQYLNQQDKDA